MGGTDMYVRLFIIGVLVLFTSCATPYQKTGFRGGFSETQLAENIFQVNFRGNGFTDTERATDFTLLRSAELALDHGFRYFVIVDSKSTQDLSSYTTPTQTQTTVNANTTGTYSNIGNFGTLNARTYGTATTKTSGGQTYLIRKPHTSNTIICFPNKPDNNQFVYDARYLMKSIKDKYKLE